MERERDAIDPDGSTEVLQQAGQRRVDDIGAWLGQIFARRRQLKAANAAAADYADGNPALH